MTDFSRYPYLQKAINEQIGLSRFLGGASELGPEMTNFITQCVNIVNECVQRTDADKEGIMVGCLLIVASPFTFDDTRRFDTEYTPQISDIVQALLKQDIDHPEFKTILGVMSVYALRETLRNGPGESINEEDSAKCLQQVTNMKELGEDILATAIEEAYNQIVAVTKPAPRTKKRPPNFDL